jgi:hypothetical protein
LLETLAVEADHHFIVNDDRRSGAALVLTDEIANCARVALDVVLFECDSSLREVRRGGVAGRSARLGKDDDFVRCHLFKD